MRKAMSGLLSVMLALSLLAGPAGALWGKAAGEDSQESATRHADGWDWGNWFTPAETETPGKEESRKDGTTAPAADGGGKDQIMPAEGNGDDPDEMNLEDLKRMREELDALIREREGQTESPAPTGTPAPTGVPEIDAGDPGIAITSLRLPGKLQIKTGETLNLAEEITVQPAEAGRSGITYSSSRQDVATVSRTGVITAVGPGTTTITAVTPEKKSGKTVLTVIQPVTEIRINETLYLGTGKTIQIRPVILPDNASNKKVKWEIENSTVATVSANGTLKGVSSGSTWVYCKAADGSNVVAARKVTVYVPVKKVTFSGKSMDLFEGQSAYPSYNLEPTDATDKRVEWSSSNPSIAKVSATTGYVTGLRAGKAILTAQCLDGSGIKATHTVYVEPRTPVTVDYFWWETDRLGIMTGRVKVDAVSNCLNKEVKSIQCTATAYGKSDLKLSSTIHTEVIRLKPGKRATSSYGAGTVPKLNSCLYVELEIVSITFRDGTIYVYPDDIRKETKCHFDINNY